MNFIINSHIVASSAFDTDALAFIIAAGITDNTQKTAVNDFVIALKDASIWTKMLAVYPFIGGTAASHKYNLKDPQDTDAAFRLTFSSGTNTHNSAGWTNSSTYADTKFNPNTHLPSTLYSFGFRVSSQNLSSGQRFMGGNDGTIFMQSGRNNHNVLHTLGGNNISTSDSPLFSGGGTGVLWSANRSATDGAVSCQGYKDGVQFGTTDHFYAGKTNVNLYLGGSNNNGSASPATQLTLVFAFIGGSLSAGEHLDLKNAVAALQTALGR